MVKKADMTVKPKQKSGGLNLSVPAKEGESADASMARAAASPSIHAAATVYQFHPLRQFMDINATRNEIAKQGQEICDGDMTRPEAMLSAQAHTLDTLFNSLAQRAGRNMEAGYTGAADTYLRLALKAQSQCRTTLEALSEIKNPRAPTFIKQQNVAHQQQVNNGVAPDFRTSTHTRPHEKNITPSNELLEHQHGERLDTGTESTAGGADKELATVGEVNGTKNDRWERT